MTMITIGLDKYIFHSNSTKFKELQRKDKEFTLAENLLREAMMP